ncbi:hypothetical protein ACLB2K_005487 [Fragaria x ananassa]
MTTSPTTSSFGSARSSFGSKRSNFSLSDHDRQHHRQDLVGGAMLPIFLNDLNHNNQDLVEITLELNNDDDDIVVCSVAPVASGTSEEEETGPGMLGRSLSATSRSLRRTFGWLIRSTSSRTAASSNSGELTLPPREARRLKAKLQRTRSGAQRALNGLRFISKTTGPSDAEELFESLAVDGLLARADFGRCIGMADSEEFAVGIFDTLARRRRQNIAKISKEELRDFWSQISDQSFDARLQIFFDMADSNEDGRITREGVQELIMLSASANKLSKLKEQAEDYASLIMEELDPENFGYIELWQLEALLLQRDVYIDYSRPLSAASVAWSQNLSSFRPKNLLRRLNRSLNCLMLDNWQRGWILLLWIVAMASLFAWKFFQYRNKPAFEVIRYCLPVAKGAAETLKLNMALILLPVCRNTLTWLRSTRARSFIPFDDSINFHKTIAFAIAIGIIVHAGNHVACDFPRLVNSSPEEFAPISADFHGKRPTYEFLFTGPEGLTGILMVIFIAISFTLAASHFRRNMVRLPAPFNKLTGFNAFWYSHHLLGLVYVLLLIHGSCLYFVHKWYQKTTWMYISVPFLLYVVERSIRTCRSKHYAVKILKASNLPGNVISLIMSKPPGFKYRSGQYIFLQCPAISPFEWHPFSITSAPGDEHLSVHIMTVGDWTKELKRAISEGDHSISIVHQAASVAAMDQRRLFNQPKLFLDGPYGAPAQDYRNYDVLLLVGLGIGATPFVSILKDLLNSTRTAQEQTDSNTETSTLDSPSSFTSSCLTPNDKKKSQRATNAHFYWVTREPGSFEWFKGVMDEVAEMDHKGQIELHNYLTSVYEESDARSTLITMVQALNHAKHGVDILSGTSVMTHFARPNWKEVFTKIASKHPFSTVGVFYCGMPMLAKELKMLSLELSQKTSTRFEFHKEYF